MVRASAPAPTTVRIEINREKDFSHIPDNQGLVSVSLPRGVVAGSFIITVEPGSEMCRYLESGVPKSQGWAREVDMPGDNRKFAGSISFRLQEILNHPSCPLPDELKEFLQSKIPFIAHGHDVKGK